MSIRREVGITTFCDSSGNSPIKTGATLEATVFSLVRQTMKEELFQDGGPLTHWTADRRLSFPRKKRWRCLKPGLKLP